MLKVKEAVIVEGKYDKIKLSSVIDGVIIPTGGFSVFKNRETLEIIRYFAKKTGIIILTDSDSAGFKIRSYLKGAIREGKIINVYVPDIFGKERRKNAPSKEGKLGVEGIDGEVILEAFRKAGITADLTEETSDPITRLDLYELGLNGGENSSEMRRALLSALDLPERLTVTGMVEILNTLMTRQELYDTVEKMNRGDK
ncbi:MAG: DUF4093 domain-containing protein [Oscillospiraceae bacterium]|nr:DUF4093 domain-containing protein [Oscillospiraceae bacterium]